MQREAALSVREQHLNDCIRDRTRDIARNIASRDYLQSTPTFQLLYNTDKLPYAHLRSILNNNMHIAPPFDITAQIVSNSGKTYDTTLFGCSCPDFQFRHSPCKHMFRLALESGLLFNFSTAPIKNDIASQMQLYDELQTKISKMRSEEKRFEQKRKSFLKLIDSKSPVGSFLADMYADLFRTYDEELVKYLQTKDRPANKAADHVKAVNQKLASLRIQSKQLEYQVRYYESLFPWLTSFKEVPPAEAFGYTPSSESASQNDRDLLRKYLSHEEYSELTNTERFQLALDRYIHRHKRSWEIGIEYERYIGYLCETKGYSVKFNGVTEKLEDMGRDLILEKDSVTILIQCKRWAKEKVIHENHVFQLAGSVFEYQYSNPERNVIGAFVTTVDFSPIAVLCAKRLDIKIFPRIPFEEYPRIKCNINRDSHGCITRIYHLPMDQQYDKVQISNAGETYVHTVKEAEALGFRRAHRWLSGQKNL